MFFGHLTEALGLLIVGLLIFGPKRMIEMGGQAGKLLRELRAAMKEMNWGVLNDDMQKIPGMSQTPLGKFSQLAQTFSGPIDSTTADASSAQPAHTVDATPDPNSSAPDAHKVE